MSSSLRPQFFCTRPNGTLTPLIALDELPSHISLRGIPRTLSPNDTQGMTSLGTVNSRAQLYVVEGVTPTTTRASTNAASQRSRNYDLQTSLMRIISDENIPTNQRLALHSLVQQGGSQSIPVNNPSTSGWLVPNGGNGSGNGGSRQNYNGRNLKKEYCSYWIRHGECDYQQQGCLYKHEMPHDLGMLEKLGLRDIPRWYREKYGIPSLLPHGNGNSRAQIGKEGGQDHSTIKSIQYPLRLGISGADHSELEKDPKLKAATYIPIQHHSAMFPPAPQPTYQCANPAIPQKQGPKNSSNQLNAAGKKIDLLSFDHLQDYSPLSTLCTSLPYRGKENNTLEAADKNQRDDIVRNLQSLVPVSLPASTDCLAFDSTLGTSQSKKMQKSRRLYQPRSPFPEGGIEITESDPLNVFQNQTTASSSGHSVGSKNTGSQLASPLTDPIHGRAMSESPTRGVSPSVHSGASLSSGSSPGVLRSRVRDKAPKRSFGAIGTKKSYRKRSVGSSEEDLFGFAKE